MPSGFFVLLDDIAVLARASVATLDDVALGAAKAAAKSAGVVIDDAAVTPQYVRGLHPSRELPVVYRIAIGSLINKFAFVLPAALLLSWLAPWMLPILLVLGGSYLAFEGAEKVLRWTGHGHAHEEDDHSISVGGTKETENRMVRSATRTDLILSTEIMLIALASLDVDNWISKAIMLALIALGMTLAVYGAVAILVKIDDIGLYLAKKKNKFLSSFGSKLAHSMPTVFNVLTVVGTIAMLWVGGHLVWKSLGDLGLTLFSTTLHSVEDFVHHFGPILGWFGDTIASAIFGLILGLIIVFVIGFIGKLITKFKGEKTENEVLHGNQ